MSVTSYLPRLDGLRGVAIILVLLFHCSLAHCDGGFVGVDVFFVVSGFLITSLLLNERDKSGTISLRNFYMRRLLRLFPALCFIVCFYMSIYLITGKPSQHIREMVAALTYCFNWDLAFHYSAIIDKVHIDAGHLWSLSIEEQYYLLWPVILSLALKNKKGKQLAMAVTLLGFCFSVGIRNYFFVENAGFPRMYFGSDTRFDNLLLGSLTAVVSSLYGAPSGSWLKWSPYLGWLGILVFLLVGKMEPVTGMYSYGFTTVGICSVAILLPALYRNEASWANRFLDIPFLTWTGKLSYSLYLWHYPILQILYRLHIPHVWGWRFFLVGSVLSYAAASFSYYVVEMPFLSLKKKFNSTVVSTSTS